jgi:hypothetical protein
VGGRDVTAAIDRLAVGDQVFVHADEARAPIRVRGRDGIVTALETERGQIRIGREGEEPVWVDLDLLRPDRRHKKRQVAWPRRN